MYKKITINKNYLYIISIGIILILIAGFRPIGIDKDSLNYTSILGVHLENANFISIEPAFWLINEFNHIVFNSEVQTFFLIFAIIGVSLKLYAVKILSTNPLMSILVYIAFYFVLHEMTQIRAGVSIALIYISIPYIINKQFFKFILLMFIAVLFHYSAIIFFLLYFLRNLYFDNKILYFILPLMGMVISSLNLVEILISNILIYLPDFLSFKIQIYINKLATGTMKTISPYNLGNFLLLIVYYINLYKVDINSSDNRTIFFLIKMLGIGFFILFSSSYLEVFAYRMSNFLFFSIVFLLPNLVRYFKQKRMIYFLLIVYLIYSLIRNASVMLNF